MVAGLLAVALLAGCSGAADGDAHPNSLASTGCTKEHLQTRKSGRLIVATGQPAYAPWVLNDAPEQGAGFEAALAYAAAERLGYEPEDVEWVRTTFAGALAPGRQSFDWNLHQYTITAQRKRLVDFSSPYLSVTQAVVSRSGSAIANATSVADLRSARLGAAAGSTALDDAQVVIQPTRPVRKYPDNAAAITALQHGRVDGIVVDLPTAFHVANEEIDDGKVVGQLPGAAADSPAQMGILLSKDSSLTKCTTRAIDSLRQDGTLQKLTDTWLNAPTAAPILAS